MRSYLIVTLVDAVAGYAIAGLRGAFTCVVLGVVVLAMLNADDKPSKAED